MEETNIINPCNSGMDGMASTLTRRGIAGLTYVCSTPRLCRLWPQLDETAYGTSSQTVHMCRYRRSMPPRKLRVHPIHIHPTYLKLTFSPHLSIPNVVNDVKAAGFIERQRSKKLGYYSIFFGEGATFIASVCGFGRSLESTA